MLNKCANPECSARFRYLHEGRLYHVDMRQTGGAGMICELCGRPHHARFYWLCGTCAAKMTVRIDIAGHVEVVPKGPAAVASANAAGKRPGEAA